MADGKAKKMWALPGAQLTAPASLLMHGGGDTLLDLPCPSFLIEHPKGLVLFDTGCNPKVIDDAVGYWGEVAKALPIKWSKADTLDKQIQGVGYKRSDARLRLARTGPRSRSLWRWRAAISLHARAYARRVLAAGQFSESHVSAHRRYGPSARGHRSGSDDAARHRPDRVGQIDQDTQGHPRYVGGDRMDYPRP